MVVNLSWGDIPDEPLLFDDFIAADRVGAMGSRGKTKRARAGFVETTIEVLKKRLPSIPDMVHGLRYETDESFCAPCPRCGGTDRFIYKTQTGRFFCRKCNQRGGDLVDFHQWIDGSSVVDLKRRYTTKETLISLGEPEPATCPAKGDDPTAHSTVDDQARQEGDGTPIDAVEVWDMESKRADFLLPAARFRRLRDYLTEQRRIPELVVKKAVDDDRICYANGRAVLKYEAINGEARTLQSIDLNDDKQPKRFCKGLPAGDAFFFAGRSFHEAEIICVVESPVNALSGAAVLPDLCWAATGSSVMVKKFGAMAGHGKKIVIAFDNDEAGEQGTKRAAEILSGENVRVVVWPDGTNDGYDLNDYLKAGQGDKIRNLIEKAGPVVSERPASTGGIVTVSLVNILSNPCAQVPIIDGLVYEGDSLVFHAGGGTGKSLLVTQIALELACCDPEFPTVLWGRLEIPGPRTTLFLQSENNNAVIYNRISRMIQGKPVLKKGLNRIFFAGSSDKRAFLTGRSLTTPEFRTELREQIEKIERAGQRVDVLVVDPLVSFHDADENDNVNMRRVLDVIMELCDRLKITPWIVHHDGKQGDIRGASAVHDWCRSRVHLVAEKSTNRNIVKVIHEKSNNTKRFEPFHLELDEEHMLFEASDFSVGPSKKDLEERQNLESVLATLKRMGGHVKNQAELEKMYVEHRGLHLSTARRHVKKAIEKRYIMPRMVDGEHVGYGASPYD